MAVLACGGSESSSQTDASATASPSASASTSGPANACEVLPATEASAVLGQTVRDSVAMLRTEGDRILSQCNYRSETDLAVAGLMLRRSAPDEAVEETSKEVRELLGDVEDIPGLGQVAFFGANQLHVWTNNGWYLIVTPSAKVGVAGARAMAEKAIANLQ